VYIYIYIYIHTRLYNILIIYNRRHMTKVICTHKLHIIHNTNATWAHTSRAHTTYNNATHSKSDTRGNTNSVHLQCVCVYYFESVHMLCIARKIGPTNSYSVWASAGMIGQGAQYESPTPYTNHRGWPSLGTWLDTSDSWQSRDSSYKENHALSINI